MYLSEWLNYLDEMVGSGVYVWGGQGQRPQDIGSDAKIAIWMRTMYKTQSDNVATNNSNAARAYGEYQRVATKIGRDNVRFFDCSGLAMYFWQQLHGVAQSDNTAHGLYAVCEKLAKSELCPGDFVFKRGSRGRMVHIGYVDRDGLIVECEKSGSGVIRRKITATNWTNFGRHPWLAGEIGGDTMAYPTVKRGSTGAAVKTLQNLLIARGYSCGSSGADGEFGAKTYAAVCAFQRDMRLDVDGIVGAKTWAALTKSVETMYKLVIVSMDRSSLERIQAEYGGKLGVVSE